MLKDRVVVAALVGWLFVGMLAAAPQFVQGPSARYGHCMAYDSARGVVVLFGGSTDPTQSPSASTLLGDTWEWDGVQWSHLSPSNAPSPRSGSSMCFDAARNVIVMFGGELPGGTLSGETWEWDGSDWALSAGLNPEPVARRGAKLAFDINRQVCVLFAGISSAGVLNDVWEWDGSQWSDASPASGSSMPPARLNHGFVYDEQAGVCWLFGGEAGTANSDFADVWSWDGSAWTAYPNASGPDGRRALAMAYDPVNAQTIMFGGKDGGTVLNDTWSWDGSNWAQIQSGFRPSARYFLNDAMVFDGASNRMLMFGGATNQQSYGDFWAFDGVEWKPELVYVTSPVNGDRYALTPPMTWQEAEQLAVLEGGHLATVRSQVEHDWIWSTYSPSLATGGFHIGLSDAATEGVWEWTSGEAVSYVNWGASQPCVGCPLENWVAMAASLGGQWADGNAAEVHRGIIEIPPPVAASAVGYGTGCGSPALTMSPSAPPLIGSVASTAISNAPLPFGGVTLGFSNTDLGGLPILPFSLTGLGMPGCFLWHSNEISGLPIVPVSPGVLSFSAAIPGNANLLGTHVYLQAYCVDPNASPRKLITSNGVDWTIGNQ